MSLPQNTSKGKRDIRHDNHNRRPGIAAFWRKTGQRKNRRNINKVNKWRVEGKVALPPLEQPKAVFHERTKHERKVWVSHFEDYLTPEQREELLRIRDRLPEAD